MAVTVRSTHRQAISRRSLGSSSTPSQWTNSAHEITHSVVGSKTATSSRMGYQVTTTEQGKDGTDHHAARWNSQIEGRGRTEWGAMRYRRTSRSHPRSATARAAAGRPRLGVSPALLRQRGAHLRRRLRPSPEGHQGTGPRYPARAPVPYQRRRRRPAPTDDGATPL